MERTEILGLSGIPVELLLQVFGNLDSIKSVIALASTCRRFYNVWASNKAAIIFPVVEAAVIAFEDALLTIRVTAIAELYINKSQEYLSLISAIGDENSGLKPIPKPEIDLTNLGSRVRKPTFDELLKVQDLFLLISCAIDLGGRMTPEFKTKYEHLKRLRSVIKYPRSHINNYLYVLFRSGWAVEGNNSDFEIEEYRIYSSLYRVFLAGAFLAPAYLEPFFTGDKRTHGFFWHPNCRDGTFIYRPRIAGTYEEEFLKKYTPYNIKHAPDNDIRAVYGPLLDYLLESGRNRVLVDEYTLQRDGVDPEDPEIEPRYREQCALQQVLMLFVAQEILRRLFAHVDSKENRVANRISLPEELYSDFIKREGRFQSYRTMKLIFYGFYELEELSFPGSVSKVGSDTWLLAEGTIEESAHDCKHRLVMDMPGILSSLDWERYLPWPEIDFFVWALRHSPGNRKFTGSTRYGGDRYDYRVQDILFQSSVFRSIGLDGLLTENSEEGD
ncbi:hypothetical protein ABW19_dt0201743 [Dactylella cylindrospora]|nr:hypothetical protein ABW19_dt0201743 [Dactylella cylindrospora]